MNVPDIWATSRPPVRVHVVERLVEWAHVFEHLEAHDEVELPDQPLVAGTRNVGDNTLVVRPGLGRRELGRRDVETDVVAVARPEIRRPAREASGTDVEDLHAGRHRRVDPFVKLVFELSLIAEWKITRDGSAGKLDGAQVFGGRGDNHVHSSWR